MLTREANGPSHGRREPGSPPRPRPAPSLPADERPGDAAPRERIRSLDGLRALAFLLVFGFHTWQFAGEPTVPVLTTILGHNTRPDFFVVLTGFVLLLPFARDPARFATFRLRPYLVRRLRRIVPPYYAALAVAIALPTALTLGARFTGFAAHSQHLPALGDVAAHLTFTHMFFPAYWDGINGSLWTMSLEMQLYLTFPLLVFVVAKRGWLTLIPVVVLSLAYRVVAGLVVQEPSFPTLFLLDSTAVGRLMQFVIGMVAAVLAIRWRSGMRWWGHAILAATVVGAYEVATAPAVAQLRHLPLRDTLLGVAFGALVILAVTSRPVERVLAIRPLARLGFVAYSVFLVHEPVAYYLSQFLERGLGVPEGHRLLELMWTVGLVVVLVVGYAFHLVIEKPCIAWSRAAVRRRLTDGADQRGGPTSEVLQTTAAGCPADQPAALEPATAPARRTWPRRRPSAAATTPRGRGTTRWCPPDPT